MYHSGGDLGFGVRILSGGNLGVGDKDYVTASFLFMFGPMTWLVDHIGNQRNMHWMKREWIGAAIGICAARDGFGI